MAAASERVEHDGAAESRKSCIDMSHEDRKESAVSQHHRITGRECQGPFVRVVGLCKVEVAASAVGHRNDLTKFLSIAASVLLVLPNLLITG
jgi:hypothetical protein